jgi:Holliday junction resolvasome RuvABC endonuclease subunit
MPTRVLSLDISASSTGWSFFPGKNNEIIFGLITTSPKCSRAERLVIYKRALGDLIIKLKPTHIVMEDIFSGLNAKTIALLAKFAGVTEEYCLSEFRIEPYVIHTNTVKSYFKVKTKEQLFWFVADLLEWQEFNFKRDNDMVDAISQLLVYYDKVLNIKKFREEKDYGYLYDIGVNNEQKH